MLMALASGCSTEPKQTALDAPEQTQDSTTPLPAIQASELPAKSDSISALTALSKSRGQVPRTTGRVPHVQLDLAPVPAVHSELLRRTFALPDVENRPTIVSLPGARGAWISDGVRLAHPEVIVAEREFTHIHPDGSLHAPLPVDRALEAIGAGWAERHPWADQREGWSGLVMLFTPSTPKELEVVIRLVVESYNFVTGRTVRPEDI